jgi:sugar phosphate isomerase/epimerase
MKLGVMAVLFGDKTLKEVCDYLVSQGVQTIEIGCGGYPGKTLCDPEVLLNDPKALQEFKDTIAASGLQISALSCHGNYIHPNKEIAEKFDNDFTNAIKLAKELGVDTINCFSGCPGDSENSIRPNWVVCPWPEDYLETLEWQWNEKLIPYWKNKVAFAKEYGVTKFAFELHPGFCVYNTESLLKLRKAVGPEIGANLDPSHLVWQGMDPVQVIKALGKENAIFHFHAKDTKIDKYNLAVNGVLDTKHFSDELNRSWIFRSVGYGNDYAYWKDIVSALRLVGYQGALSIEHEDSLMTPIEGLEKAIALLKEVIIFEEKPTEMWWA